MRQPTALDCALYYKSCSAGRAWELMLHQNYMQHGVCKLASQYCVLYGTHRPLACCETKPSVLGDYEGLSTLAQAVHLTATRAVVGEGLHDKRSHSYSQPG